MTAIQVASVILDLADAHGWNPEQLKHLTIAELIFWRSRNLTGNAIGRYTAFGE